MKSKKNVSMKILVLMMALVLLIGCGIGGTLAWLLSNTETVTNTFTVGNINIDLKETVDGSKVSASQSDVANDGFKIVPGTEADKDPEVSVTAGSEACWLFVKIEEDFDPVMVSGTQYDFDSFITYTVADPWKPVSGHSGVYYIAVDAATANAGATYGVLTGNKVSIPSTVEKAMVDAIVDTNKPQLLFTAYAIQSEGLKDADGDPIADAAAAWTLISTP